MVLTSGASMLANGSDVALGDKPIASNSGITLDIVDSTTGQSGNPTLYSMNTYTLQIQTIQSVLYDVTNKISNLANANTYINEFSSMTDGLGDAVFSAPFDLYSGNAAYSVMHTNDSIDSVLTYGRTESALVLGGSINGNEIEGDAKKFATVLSSAISFTQLSNEYINAANNSGNIFSAGTFPGMDSVSSGALSGTNYAGVAMGNDCSLLGTVVNFQQLADLGSPGQLLNNMLDAGTLGPMYAKLAKIVISPRLATSLGATGITTNVLLGTLGIDFNTLARSGSRLPRGIQEQIFIAFATLTTLEVSQVKAILSCTQPAVVSGSDLFDPTKLFATSFTTLTAPLSANGISSRAIYINDTGSVNPVFESLGERLYGIIPDNLAIANGALIRSLGQIKGIESTGITEFTNAATNLETMKGLPDIQSLTSYIPDGVAQYWQNYYGVESNIQLATGPNDNFTVADIIGYAAGFNSAAPLQQNYDLLSTMSTNGQLDVFYKDDGSSSTNTGILVVLEYLIDGVYVVGSNWVIPAGVYGAGTYGTFGAAYTAVINAAKSLMQSVYSTNTTAQTVQANFKRLQEQQAREKLLRAKMGLILTNIQSSESNAISLSSTIPAYALDTTGGGVAEYLERIVNINSLGGQAIVAAMRESRNINKLEEAQLQQDGYIAAIPPSNPGSLSNSQYTVAEASTIIVK